MEAYNGEPISLRGHTLLCLQGFVGKGYSLGFIENLSRIHTHLKENPQARVKVVIEPDAVCGACPHYGEQGCMIDGSGSEEDMIAQDKRVLSLLGLQPGTVLSWQNLLELIGTSVVGDNLPEICGTCRWLPLGYCAEGIDRLHRKLTVLPSNESCPDSHSPHSMDESV